MSKLVKVDKNGTEYYADYTCDRCGGVGGADAWNYTGWKCYKCGGSGKLDIPHIYKKYTPEYQAKLDASRAKREEKKRLQRVEEFKNHLGELLEKKGFGANGKIYVVLGNTYDIREELKEAGARYNPIVRWYFTEDQDKYDTVEVDYTEYFDVNPEYGTLVEKDGWVIQEVIDSKVQKTEAPKAGEYVGTVGKREEFEVTYTGSAEFEFRNNYSYRTETNYYHKFEDANGNKLVWKTSYPFWKEPDGDDPYAPYVRYKIGAKVILKATVKEHSNYKSEKQTVLTRCKVVG